MTAPKELPAPTGIRGIKRAASLSPEVIAFQKEARELRGGSGFGCSHHLTSVKKTKLDFVQQWVDSSPNEVSALVGRDNWAKLRLRLDIPHHANCLNEIG